MSNHSIKILTILIITTIFCAVVGMFGYLGYTTYKKETICSDYTKGNTMAVKELILESSISVDYGCPYPFLAYSSSIGDIDMVKFLLENGAEVKKRFTFRNPKTYPYKVVHNPLFYAVYSKYEKKRIDFPLEINEDFIACLELLIKNGASLDTPCGREYNKNASDSLKIVYRKESPDTQTAREIIKLIDDEMLNNFADKY